MNLHHLLGNYLHSNRSRRKKNPKLVLIKPYTDNCARDFMFQNVKCKERVTYDEILNFIPQNPVAFQ